MTSAAEAPCPLRPVLDAGRCGTLGPPRRGGASASRTCRRRPHRCELPGGRRGRRRPGPHDVAQRQRWPVRQPSCGRAGPRQGDDVTGATIAVGGGGITGLAAAYELSRGGDAPGVVLLEAGDRLGGKITTTEFAGVPVDCGPDAILARVPWAGELLRELGLGPQIVSPAHGASVYARGRLRPLPEGLVRGVPSQVLPILRSGILSPSGIARAGLDLVLPRHNHGG